MQPKNSNSGVLHFNKVICYQLYISFIKFFIVNTYLNEMI